jgi:hypothetical protein
VDIAEQNHTCHRCAAIPNEPTFAAKVRRAAMSQLRDAVQRGERNLAQAGGAANMTRAEVVVCATQASAAVRRKSIQLVAAQSVIRNLKEKNDVASVIRRNNPEVMFSCTCTYGCDEVSLSVRYVLMPSRLSVCTGCAGIGVGGGGHPYQHATSWKTEV